MGGDAMNRPARRARLNDIAEIATTMRSAPIEAPDFTSSILDRVDVERPFLAPSVRRRLPWIRMGLGACVALGTLAMALTHRWAPEVVQLADQSAPISNVVQSIECATCQKFASYRPSVLNVTEQDASRFFAAIVTAANASENEGRRPGVVSDTPMTVTALLPLSQAVPLDLPAPPSNAFVASARSLNNPANRFRASLVTEQSVLSESGGPAMRISSTDLAKPKATRAFLEHDLDGQSFPR